MAKFLANYAIPDAACSLARGADVQFVLRIEKTRI